ncbi:CoA transferase subunit A [Desulfosporosinus sp. BICA1-9]|uniref:CoA transferase subunit A n=1 Tax=Desulfosporosinus sp. BICA1-9 TaxID=1531958 RepID=UPI00054B01AA|nr:3-oxoacid CoA-transferase subunit A [Desulfosporosinus sp. BICA1-9]KJS45942.1 MAG: branched-chain amino acid dehydrogenase [Peptococcaceae bacterium BRH_c23]KJS90551.1 MAG: branched-chain amino acid dehydrogenase [Desulfosporosinus sp. BICA1-9]HBW35645.1 3-oxoacid CoA-transferase subunit A [Desulfosporosinus sp.]
MAKLVRLEEAISKVEDGMTLMVGGFIGCGAPDQLLEEVCRKGTKELTLIANDTGILGDAMSQLIVKRCVSKLIATHIGTNKETGKQMTAGELDVKLVPQGTLVEQIRAAGAGLGGILTPTGIGTIIEEGKQKLVINGIEYLLELPVRANVALLNAFKADKAGNLVYHRSARNFNPLMAMAADLVIAQVNQIVEVGEIDPDEVITPGIFIDYLVQKQPQEVSKVG